MHEFSRYTHLKWLIFTIFDKNKVHKPMINTFSGSILTIKTVTFCWFVNNSCASIHAIDWSASQYTAWDTPRVTHLRRLADPRVAYSAHCVRFARGGRTAEQGSACGAFMHFGATWNVLICYKTLTVHSRRNAVQIRESPHFHTTPVFSR